MVMMHEGGSEVTTPYEVSDYNNGQYWATIFENQCHIKKSTSWPQTDVNRYLASGGINGRDAEQATINSVPP